MKTPTTKTLIAQGAEAKVYETRDTIIKHRFKKSYRHEELDYKLRKSRTRREAKILQKLNHLNFPSPQFIDINEKTTTLTMEKIKGKKLRDIFNKNHQTYAKELGKTIAQLHNQSIIHGDLTTSNMILQQDAKKESGKQKGAKKKKTEQIMLIDFGLSFTSPKVEDKAVDLHLLRQALESKHNAVYKKSYKTLLTEYTKRAKDAKAIIKRLDVVEGRGRNKKH